MSTQDTEKRLLAMLTELGGESIQDDTLVREGTRLVLPENMTSAEAIDYLAAYRERETQIQTYSHTFRARPWDGAAALERALRKLFGTAGIQRGQESFFGSTPPERRTVKVGVNETLDVPWGQIDVPMLKGKLATHDIMDEEYGVMFAITVVAPRSMQAAVKGLFKVVEDELREHSIYKGKAITGQQDPEFLDLSTLDPQSVVYSERDQRKLDANLWSLLRYTDEHRNEGLPLKRAIVLGGEYGTGKTLTALRTAQIAEQNGWGFIMCRPGRDNIEQVFATARLLQPCVVFFEDIDTLGAADEDGEHISRVLDMFDGLSAKGTELIAVVTTNHLDRLHKGMLRPGRLDAVIEFEGLDEDAFRRLVERSVGVHNLVADVDWSAVAEAMDRFKPAWVNEAATRAKRYSMVENAGQVGTLTTQHLVDAALDLRPQYDLHDGADESVETPSVDRAIRETVDEALNATAIVYHGDEDNVLGVVKANGERPESVRA